MRHACAQVPTSIKHTRRLANCARHVVNHLERVVGDYSIEATIGKRECGTRRSCIRSRRIVLSRVAKECASSIDRRDSMPPCYQVTRDSAFTTTDLKGSSTRRGNHEIEEAVPVVPVRIVTWVASPPDPVLRFRFPLSFRHHDPNLGRAHSPIRAMCTAVEPERFSTRVRCLVVFHVSAATDRTGGCGRGGVPPRARGCVRR
jgi:hypothetical protein